MTRSRRWFGATSSRRPALRTWLAILAACVALAVPAHAQAPAAGEKAAAPGSAAAAREARLAAELRCLVCQNQSIAESNADLAVDLRRQIREMIAQGRSDAEIRDYMTARYGDFVLYRPPLKGTTVLLWFGPALLLAAGVAIAWRVVRRRRAAEVGAAATLTPEERARAARLLGEDDAGTASTDDAGAAAGRTAQ